MSEYDMDSSRIAVIFQFIQGPRYIKWVHCLQMFCPSKGLKRVLMALVNLIIIVIIIRGTTERYLQVILVFLPLSKITLASLAFSLYTS